MSFSTWGYDIKTGNFTFKKTKPAKKPPTPKRPKPAGGYIWQAMEAEKESDAKVEKLAEALWNANEKRTKEGPEYVTAWSYHVRRQIIRGESSFIVEQYRTLAETAIRHLRSKP